MTKHPAKTKKISAKKRHLIRNKNTQKFHWIMPALVLLAIPMIFAFRPTHAASLTFPVTADASLRKDTATTNYGTVTSYKADNSPVQNFVIKFKISGTTGQTVSGAKLHLYITDSSVSGGIFRRMSTSWSQSTITWANAPSSSTTNIASLGAVAAGAWVTVDMSSMVKGDGTYALRASSTSNDGASYASIESTHKPYVTLAAFSPSPGVSPTPIPTAKPTPTPTPKPTATPLPTATPISTISSANPCAGTAAPASWKHVVVLMFENKHYSDVIGPAAFITNLTKKCGTYSNWKDANYKVNGSIDGNYFSKPNYATLTSGVPPSVHGLKSDSYSDTSSVDNIFNRLRLANKSTKAYGAGGSGSCASSNFSGAYHDAMRFYTDLGGQSSSSSTFCNTHDVSISSFMTDVNSGKLPAFSMVFPSNTQNMHDNSVSSGDSWASSFLKPLLDSAQYKSGDTAIFFLWDEDAPIPNVLMAPSIRPGTKPTTTGNPISHYSALRTWQEMLGISPLLGDTAQAPSLLQFYNGK